MKAITYSEPSTKPHLLRKRSSSAPSPTATELNNNNSSTDSPQHPGVVGTNQPSSKLSSHSPLRRLFVRKLQPGGPNMRLEDVERELSTRTGRTPQVERPTMAGRQPSFQKRSASFGSPREIALPTPTEKQPYGYFNLPSPDTRSSQAVASVLDSNENVFDSESDPSSPSLSSSPDDRHPSQLSPFDSAPSESSFTSASDSHSKSPPLEGDAFQDTHSPRSHQLLQRQYSSQVSAVTSHPRPYSLPHHHSGSVRQPVAQSPSPQYRPDRSSSTSLPLPMQIPYFTLPGATAKREPSSTSSSSRPTTKPSTPSPPRPPPMTSSYGDNPRMDRFSTASSSSSESVYPEPEPPEILPSEQGAAPDSKAPYAPFLSHAPAPEDSWITVETTVSNYLLVCRLPGFSRDGITLATRRRRILHVVADSWVGRGGHFERRISFGYDADLSQVRAEFDGEHLKITIPRRLPPVPWLPRAAP